MILFVSGRCDIVAFYTPWFMNRLKEGFVDVRNPFNKKLVSRIYFDDVDLIYFCTKDPRPIIPYLKEINKPILFNVTITPYKRDIEVNVIDKDKIIDSVKDISKIVGIDNIYVRYDPIFLSDKYNLDYHIKAFNRLCSLLNGYVKHIIISFIDDYKNVKKNMNVLKVVPFTNNDYKIIGENFSSIASKYNMTVQTCFEKINLVEYGFIKGDCLGVELASRLTGETKFKKSKIRKGNLCNCVEMVDIGYYNSCKHFCKYCYANYSENDVISNYQKHNVNSSLLVGELEKDDIIKVRKR